MNWDSSTIWIIVAVVALLALYFYNRSRPAPRGSYDDKNTRSSGSIGGGDRAYNDAAHRSSGSIGGGQRGYDTPEHESRGSIGGGPATPRTTTAPANGNRTVERELNRGIDLGNPLERTNQAHTTAPHTNANDERQPDDERFRSKGSIGG